MSIVPKTCGSGGESREEVKAGYPFLHISEAAPLTVATCCGLLMACGTADAHPYTCIFVRTFTDDTFPSSFPDP